MSKPLSEQTRPKDEELLRAAVIEAAAAQGVTLAGAWALPAGPFRVGALLDRLSAGKPVAAELVFGPFALVAADNVLRRADGTMLRLTEKERDILAALHGCGGAMMERVALLEAVWGYAADVETHTLETHIYRLRQKIEADPAKPVLLLTEESGYRLAL